MSIRNDLLAGGTLLFDGSMGTYYQSLYPDGSFAEEANLSHPERVLAIHRAYLEAGAGALKTNSFAANTASLGRPFPQVREVLQAAWALACRAAAGTNAYIFADIGPIGGQDEAAAAEEYRHIADTFLALGADCFLLETFPEAEPALELAKHIRSAAPDAFVIASFAVRPEGFTSAGSDAASLMRAAADCGAVDAAGFNCVSSPAHMVQLMRDVRPGIRPPLLTAMPNAGYPTQQRGRIVYSGRADYFGGRLADLRAEGVQILGGCCGTSPEFIRAAAEALRMAPRTAEMQAPASVSERPRPLNRLSDKLDTGSRLIAVELDPPDSDDITAFLDGARRMRDAGADAITVADCPIARARADSSMLAAKLHRELGIDPIPHMTCRDRNINATRALLLGLSIEDVHNVLLVTGDPIATEDREQVKGVFSFTSTSLAAYLKGLGERGTVAPFRIYGALNVNAPNFQAELRKALRKEENGITCFLTQPVITDRAFDNLASAHQALHSPILGGIYPIISERNARFMQNEVNGIEVGEDVIARYAGLDRAQGEELAVTLSRELAARMLPYTAGFYLMTPFRRIGLMERVIAAISALSADQ